MSESCKECECVISSNDVVLCSLCGYEYIFKKSLVIDEENITHNVKLCLSCCRGKSLDEKLLCDWCT